jgi:hypothetical protein
MKYSSYSRASSLNRTDLLRKSIFTSAERVLGIRVSNEDDSGVIDTMKRYMNHRKKVLALFARVSVAEIDRWRESSRVIFLLHATCRLEEQQQQQSTHTHILYRIP